MSDPTTGPYVGAPPAGAGGYPPAAAAPPPRRGRPWLPLIVAGVVVLVVLCAGLVVAGRHFFPGKPDPIVGRWSDGHGTVYEITDAGHAEFTGEVVQNSGYVCTPVDIKLTGKHGHYTGTEAFYQVPCSTKKYLGLGTITVDLLPGNATADVHWTPPSSNGACANCAALRWTRERR